MKNPDRDKIFKFKQFSVRNSESAMRVGTDAVLLGAWVSLPSTTAGEPTHILDVGTGCGVIALMLAQRSPTSEICGLEIDPKACGEAQINFEASPWAARLSCVCADFLKFCHTDQRPLDLIVSNPPFFTETTLSPDTSRAMARSQTFLPLSSLIQGAASLLRPGGTFALVLPAGFEAEVEYLAIASRMQLRRICRVRTSPRKPPTRILVELSRPAESSRPPELSLSAELSLPPESTHLSSACDWTTVTTELTIHGAPINGIPTYTEEYTDLVKDFYLKF